MTKTALIMKYTLKRYYSYKYNFSFSKYYFNFTYGNTGKE